MKDVFVLTVAGEGSPVLLGVFDDIAQVHEVVALETAGTLANLDDADNYISQERTDDENANVTYTYVVYKDAEDFDPTLTFTIARVTTNVYLTDGKQVSL